jgi:hypothetical protein
VSDFDNPDTGGPLFHVPPPPSYSPALPPPPAFLSPPRRRQRWPVVVAIVAVVAGLAATGGVLYANNKAPFTDSGVQMCKTMAANQNANRGSSGTGFDRAAAEQARATFAGSRHSDLAATGVTLVDDVISLNASGATQDPSQLSGALFGAMSIIGDIKAARTTEWRCPRSLIDPSGGNSATHSSDEVSACKADAETMTIPAEAYYARNGTYARRHGDAGHPRFPALRADRCGLWPNPDHHPSDGDLGPVRVGPMRITSCPRRRASAPRW